MLCDHPGHVHIGVEDRVVEILDVGAVHTEDVPNIQRGHRVDQIVDHPLLWAWTPHCYAQLLSESAVCVSL